MRQIFFKASDHSYFTEDGSAKPISVGGLWKPFFSEFDAEAVATKKAFQILVPEIYTKTKSDIGFNHPDFVKELRNRYDGPTEDIDEIKWGFIKQWANKREKGTRFHSLKEHEDIERGFVINPFDNKEYKVLTWEKDKRFDNETCPVPLTEIEDGYIPELLVDSEYYNVAGQIDKFYKETIGGVKYIDIDDWKTDDKIEKLPFYHPRNGYKMMKREMSHIYDTNFWQYVCKISSYAKILESHGFVVRNLAITNVVVNDDLGIDKEQRFILPYKSFEAAMVMKLWKNKYVNYWKK